MNPPIDHKQVLEHLQDELDGVLLYRALARAEENPSLAGFYNGLADIEQRHADRWTADLQRAGVTVPPHKPSWRTRTLIWTARRFGVNSVLPTISAREQIDAQRYAQETTASAESGDEKSHAWLLQQAVGTVQGGLEGGAIAQLEGRHRAGGGNALRAAVLGANDGLVSNLSLVMGVAGAEMAGGAILVTGLAGLLAGAFSMALGEWLSVQSSRELYERQIAVEKAEIASNPEEEVEELTLIYQSRGVDAAQARATAQRILSDRTGALDTLAREELGIDPKELGGSAWEAAFTSLVLFAVGAIIPVLAFFFLDGMTAVIASLVLSTLGLFAIGAGITLFTGRSVLSSGSRQIAFGLAAAAITWLIGRLIGVSLAG